MTKLDAESRHLRARAALLREQRLARAQGKQERAPASRQIAERRPITATHIAKTYETSIAMVGRIRVALGFDGSSPHLCFAEIKPVSDSESPSPRPHFFYTPAGAQLVGDQLLARDLITAEFHALVSWEVR